MVLVYSIINIFSSNSPVIFAEVSTKNSLLLVLYVEAKLSCCGFLLFVFSQMFTQQYAVLQAFTYALIVKFPVEFNINNMLSLFRGWITVAVSCFTPHKTRDRCTPCWPKWGTGFVHGVKLFMSNMICSLSPLYQSFCFSSLSFYLPPLELFIPLFPLLFPLSPPHFYLSSFSLIFLWFSLHSTVPSPLRWAVFSGRSHMYSC